MQFKRWVARHETVAKDLAQGAILVESEMDDDTESELVDEDEEEYLNPDIVEWLRAWERKESLSERARRLASM